MDIKRSVTILLPDDSDLRETVVAFGGVQQALSEPCYNNGQPLSAIALHHAMYAQVVGTLNSQMTCSAIRLTAGAYASARSNGRPAQHAFRFRNARALFLIGQRGRDADFRADGALSIWTVAGRKRINYTVPEVFKPTLASAKEIDSLTVIERNGRLLGRVTVTLEAPESVGIHPVGIDLNETNTLVAVDPEGNTLFVSGRAVKVANKRNYKTRKRVQQKLPWGQTGGHADTTEAIERTLALAVRYAFQPQELATAISSNARLTQIDDTVLSMTVAYGAVLGLLVQGHTLNKSLSGKLMRLVKNGKLPFHAVTHENLQPPQPGDPDPPRIGRFASPDALLTPSYVAAAAVDPDIRIEPAWKVSIVYGMPCAIYHQLPAAYYLAARFSGDFESAVLNAVNGGGQNQARATLAGALVGAQTGLSGIPQRFLNGLEEIEELKRLAMELASKAGPSPAGEGS